MCEAITYLSLDVRAVCQMQLGDSPRSPQTPRPQLIEALSGLEEDHFPLHTKSYDRASYELKTKHYKQEYTVFFDR
jgi:hypothetical protein